MKISINTINSILQFTYLYIFLLSITVFWIFIFFNNKKKSIVTRIRDKPLFLWIIYKPIEFMAAILLYVFGKKNKNSIQKKINKINKNYSAQKFYELKVISIFLILLVVFAIYSTNAIGHKKEVIEDFKSNQGLNILEVSSDEYIVQENESLESKKIKEHKLYNMLQTQYGEVTRYASDEENVKEISRFLVGTGMDSQEAYIVADRLYRKALKIDLYKIPLRLYMIIILIGFIFPDMILSFVIKKKQTKYKKDVSTLKISTYLLAAMNTSMKEILKCLMSISKVYRPSIETCLMNYNSAEKGREKAIMAMAEEVQENQFTKLCVIMKDAVIGSKERAVRNLEDDIQRQDKEEILIMEGKIDNRGLIAIGLIAPMMLLTMLIFLLPFSSYYQNAL